MFQYRAFGLKIASCFEFPEFMPFSFEGGADVRVRLGVSLCQFQSETQSEYFDDFGMNYQLRVKDIANYDVRGGNQINIEVKCENQLNAVRLYCLSNAFAAILYQRNLIPLHASGIVVDDKLALFLGSSGSGKSTLLMSLRQKGERIFSDDVCVPFMHGRGDVLVHASYPMIKCWGDTLDFLDAVNEEKHLLLQGRDKYGIFFHQEFHLQALAPKFLFFLEKSDHESAVRLKTLSGVEVFSKLIAEIYRGKHFREEQHGKVLFEVLTNLISQTKAFVVTRPAVENSINSLTDMVIQQILV